MLKSTVVFRTAQVLCVLVVLGVSADAVIVPRSVEDLTKSSSDVIRGVVISQTAQWDPSHTYIYTSVTVEITDVLAGSLEETARINIHTLGGEVGDTGLFIEHAASFANGEDVILFLAERGNAYEVTGWEQGKLRVENDRVPQLNLSVTEVADRVSAAQR